MKKINKNNIIFIIATIIGFIVLGFEIHFWWTHNGLHTSEWDFFLLYPKQVIVTVIIEIICLTIMTKSSK